MTPRQRFLAALDRKPTDTPAVGNPTSIATVDLMERTGCAFPDVHTDAGKMATLAAAGYGVLGYDTIAPYFSVVAEAAAFGAEINWGNPTQMPAVRGRLYTNPEDIRIPETLLDCAPTRTVLDAISLLRSRFGYEVAIVGKAFGPWTLAYHLFGLESFLIAVLDDPPKVRAILEGLWEVAVLFGKAQVEVGADCLTLADHLTGDLCRAENYRDFLLPFHQRLAASLPCPVILHICGYTLDRLDFLCQSGFAAFHFDSKNDARKARQVAAERMVLVGNVSNQTLAAGDLQAIGKEVRYALDSGVSIIAPECAVPMTVESDALKAIEKSARTLHQSKLV